METVIEDIEKSPQDKRSYRYLKLSNELQAILVSDDTTEKASAALAVRVGALCDPDDIPGIAHFCEHMLFLGTEKYPSENEYSEYLSQYGGSSNAFTTDEFTTYYFDVASDHLKGALDRFSQFFIGPLFNESAKDREVNAVDSENTNHLQVDNIRTHQMSRAHSRPGHPYRKFITGSKETLEKRPKELGLDVRKALLNFHSTYYSSNIMTLAVLGKESLDELVDLTRELFTPVKNKSVPVPFFPEHPYSDNETQMKFEYVPIAEERQLTIEFPLADFTEYYNSLPTNYVAHLIGHEGKGSLLSLLREKGWCNKLLAGPTAGAKGFMFFIVEVDLTEKGEEHVENIMTALFQYLAMLREKGPQEWIYKEFSNLDAIKFRFKEKEKPRSCTVALCLNLQNCAPRDVLCCEYMRNYRPDLIEQVLDHLHPQHVRIYVWSKKFAGKTDLVEPWYSSHYNAFKIDPELVKGWSSAKPIADLHLPAPNNFIPTDFDLVAREETDCNDVANFPALIKDSALTRVWFKQDDTFMLPKACLSFTFRTPVAYQDAQSCAYLDLFTSLLEDALTEFSYAAELAEVEYNLQTNIYGITLTILGYSHKQDILLAKIIDQMTTFVVNPNKFAIFKDREIRHFKNFDAKQPYQHCIHYLNAVVASRKWTNPEIAATQEGMTCDGLQKYISDFFSHIHIEALLYGNLTQQRALDLVGIVEDAVTSNLGCQPHLTPVTPHTQVVLPDNSACQYTTENRVHSSCSVTLYIQAGPQDTRRKMLIELIAQILSEPCFNTLRTQEQLGYIVSSGIVSIHSVLGFQVLVQSTKSPIFVERRIEAFLLTSLVLLESMTGEDFEKHRNAVEVKRTEKPKTLKQQFSKYAQEVYNFQYHFDRVNVEVACLKQLSKKDILIFFREHLVPGAPQRRKVIIHVVPTSPVEEKQSDKIEVPKSDTEESHANNSDEIDAHLSEPTHIKDLTEFKSQLSLYPPAEPYSKNFLKKAS